jgi:hypothetical protein
LFGQAGRSRGRLPGVALDIREDHGKLSSSIVLYLIRNDDEGWRVPW